MGRFLASATILPWISGRAPARVQRAAGSVFSSPCRVGGGKKNPRVKCQGPALLWWAGQCSDLSMPACLLVCSLSVVGGLPLLVITSYVRTDDDLSQGSPGCSLWTRLDRPVLSRGITVACGTSHSSSFSSTAIQGWPKPS